MPPEIFVFFGLIATGKSTVAEAWATQNGMKSFNSDRVRKELAGMVPQRQQREAFNAGIYSTEFTRKTYDALLAHTEETITAGHSVVLDASYSSMSERKRVVAFAKKRNVGLTFIHCICPERELKQRMEERQKDPDAVSDGRWEIYLVQKEKFEEPGELDPASLLVLDTNATVDVLLSRLEKQLLSRGKFT